MDVLSLLMISGDGVLSCILKSKTYDLGLGRDHQLAEALRDADAMLQQDYTVSSKAPDLTFGTLLVVSLRQAGDDDGPNRQIISHSLFS